MHSPESFAAQGEQLLKGGAALLAYDTLAFGLKEFPGDTRLRQLVALALARTGASRRANEMLAELAHEGHTDEETLGLLARTHKDLAVYAANDRERRMHLTRAFQFYRDAHRLSRGYYSGINAATLALLVGERDDASALAKAVRDQCAALRSADPDRADIYWVLATLGEAAMILQAWPEAENWYRQAIAAGRRRVGDLVSTRRNLRLIVQHVGVDGASIERLFHVPRVAVFAGHLIDRPGRSSPRFPPAAEDAVRQALRERLRRADVGFGYSSAACGGDILFLEALNEIGAEIRIVLPYDKDQFRQDSVDFVPASNWGARYERALSSAAEVVTASDQRMAGGGMSFEYGFLVLDGAAGVRADELDTELFRLALWDGKPAEGRGGTAWSVARWRTSGPEPDIIDLADIVRGGQIEVVALPQVVARPADDGSANAPAFTPEIVGLLFADAHGFSKLTEDEVPRFVEHFLGAVAAEIDRSLHPPILVNTWGDGCYFVFRGVRETGMFALNVCDAVRSTDWKAKGFREDLTLRIGLHAGPAYECLDPITKRPNYIGAHVSRAARIEPITPPGEVYASGAFAALARADQVHDFVCSYVGQTPLAKGYGTFPTYVVHRRR